jgi:hypothetical protein
LTNLTCLPRPQAVALAGREALRTPWDFHKSIFKDYRPDTQNLLDECFELDWSHTKCEKMIRGEGESQKVKALMKSVYVHLREGYKYYAGIQPLGRIPCLSPGTLTELFHRCPGFIDNKTIKLTDIDLAVIACNGGMRGANWLNPEKALCRFQMIEVLVRLAQDKYLKTGVAKSCSEAV